MSMFDFLRGFLGVSGRHYGGRSDPFFDTMTREDDDDEEEGDFFWDGVRGDQQDPFDDALRFTFGIDPDGMREHTFTMFGHILKDMEEIFAQGSRWEGRPESGHLAPPSITGPSSSKNRAGPNSGNSLRDYMLKDPESSRPGPPHHSQPFEPPHFHHTPFRDWSSFSEGLQRNPVDEPKQDRVFTGGLDQILAPPTGPNQPRTGSFFHSVFVSKVVKPDGTVEERRTVRDGHGNEETTVTRSGGPGVNPEGLLGPPLQGEPPLSSDLRDDDSLLSKLFGGFKS